MKEQNFAEYHALSAQYYFKSERAAQKRFRVLDTYQGILGYDQVSGGFLVVHKGHSPTGLEQELPVCGLLKQLGFGVILLEEPAYNVAADARILDREFEIKRIANSRNIHTAVFYQFRTAYRKSPNLLLHIDQTVNLESLRNALFISVKRYAKIRLIWVVYEANLWQFDRNIILRGKHQFYQK